MDWKKTGFMVGAIAGVLLGMKYVFPVMLPFLLGWILSELLYPAAACLANKRICRGIHLTEGRIGGGLLLIFILLLSGGFLFGAGILAQKWDYFIRYIPVLESLSDRTVEKAVHSVKICASGVGKIMVSMVSAVLFLQERERIKSIIQKQKFYVKIKEINEQILKGIKQYVRAQITLMLIIGAVCVIGLWILRIKGFLGWGVLIGMLDALPFLGTGLFLVPSGIVFLISGKTRTGIGFILLYLLTASIRQFLEPKLLGNHMNISPLCVLASIYLGVVLYGGVGFILGPLSALILYEIFESYEVFRKSL